MDAPDETLTGYPESFLKRLAHPYLFFSRAEREGLAERMRHPGFADSFLVLKRQAEHDLTFPTMGQPRPRQGGGQPDNGPRGFHAIVMRSAFMFAVTGERRYLERCMREIEAVERTEWLSESYRSRLNDPANAIHFADLGLGERAQALAAAYDWLYEGLDETQRAFIREMARERVFKPYLIAAMRRGEWGVREYMNWGAVITGGCGVLALAMLGELPEAREAWKTAVWLFPRFVNAIGRDGDWDEGLMYTDYAMRYGGVLVAATRRTLGYDFGWGERFKNVGRYCAHLKWTDANGTKRQFRFRDSCPGWARPFVPVLMGLHPEDGELVRLWDATPTDTQPSGPEGVQSSTHDYSFWTFDSLLFRPVVPVDRKAPALPKAKHYRDTGIFAWRGERLHVCALGIDTGRNHLQFDMGSFELAYDGEPLVTDMNYGDKSSLQHNCLEVNGGGQVLRAASRMTGFQTGPGEAWAAITLELPPLYGPILPSYRRHFLVWRDCAVVVVDEAESCEAAAFAARFTTFQEAQVLASAASAQACGRIASARRSVLLASWTGDARTEAEVRPATSAREIAGESYRQLRVHLPEPRKTLRWVHVLRAFDPAQEALAERTFVRFHNEPRGFGVELLDTQGRWERLRGLPDADGALRWEVLSAAK